jgi:hypothetical protein
MLEMPVAEGTCFPLESLEITDIGTSVSEWP